MRRMMRVITISMPSKKRYRGKKNLKVKVTAKSSWRSSIN
jgi:hypothetical protein